MDDRGLEVLLRHAFESSADALALVDLGPGRRGRLLRVNPAFVTLTRYEPEAVPHLWLWDLADGPTAEGWRRLVERWATAGPGCGPTEHRCRRADGATLTVEVTGVPVGDDGGSLTHAVVRLVDVAGRRPVDVAAPEASEAAWHDRLTGVLNREGLQRRLAARTGSGSSRHGAGALLFCDVDGLKDVNDRLGHLAGDAVIKATAGRLTACVRAGDVVARFGGDEFVVISWGVTGPAVESLVRRVGAALADPVPYDEGAVPVTVSVGAAELDPGAATVEATLRRADAAMYAAKQRRRPSANGD